MTNNELKQLRRLLFLDVSEAAALIAGCESRTWQRWEKGDRAIPSDVIRTIKMLSLMRVERLQVEFDETDPNYRYFDTFGEYKAAGGAGNEIRWRLAQSVASTLLCELKADEWRDEETID
ncbi:Aca2/YdiL-like domain-containing protein [Photobacterium leiognathi]|uniref:Aca2/YdiL-like domain-containing protein n=1 Tax=Photobacterium leiognathi TaxID=553611 RepID=UPI002980A4E4|nr:DUF1870 family protein [Photobacterium leiognathi]